VIYHLWCSNNLYRSLGHCLYWQLFKKHSNCSNSLNLPTMIYLHLFWILLFLMK